MEQIKVGIIGIGNMGSAHARNMHQVKTAKLTAVCDINPKAFDRISEEIRKDITCYESTAEFFAKSGCQLVIIAVPHYAHPDLAIAAMNAGMNFIVEKPICVHKADAERLLAECAKHPELAKACMFNQRTRNAHKKIKQLIEDGHLGKINRINWIITDWFRAQSYYDSGDWRASWRGEGGGVLTNQCPHQLDLWQWLFGMPDMVSAHVHYGKFHDIEVEDYVNAYMEYKNGATGNFITTTGEAPGTNRLEIAAERGRLIFENGKITFKRNEIESTQFIRENNGGFGVPECWDCEIPYFPDSADRVEHMRVLANVIDHIQNKAELVSPVEEGINGVELGNAMMLSDWTKGPVTLPIDSKQHLGFLEKLIATSRYPKKVVAQDGAAASGFDSSF